MKRLALLLVLTLFLAFTAAANDGQIPIGGKTTCNGPCPTSATATTTSTADNSVTTDPTSDGMDISTIILDVLQTIRVL